MPFRFVFDLIKYLKGTYSVLCAICISYVNNNTNISLEIQKEAIEQFSTNNVQYEIVFSVILHNINYTNNLICIV